MSSAATFVDIDPRIRIIGSLLGQSRSRRRGRSHDVVGSRPYVPGDDMRRIDWAASARLTSIAGEERFVVREFYAEEAPTVVVAVDRTPSMILYPDWLPWLHKPAAVSQCVAAIVASAVQRRSLVALASSASDALDRPCPAEGLVPTLGEELAEPRCDWLSPRMVAARSWLPPGTLVFVLSDYLLGPDEALIGFALDFEWELVPIVVSDPRWERSFPEEVGGLTVPLAAADGRLRPRRISAREAAARREENEGRSERTLRAFRDADFPPVVLSRDSADGIAESFVVWSAERETVLPT